MRWYQFTRKSCWNKTSWHLACDSNNLPNANVFFHSKIVFGENKQSFKPKNIADIIFVFAISFPCWILDPIPMLILNSYPALMTLNGGCLCGVMSFVITTLLVMREWGLKELHFKNNRNVFFIYCNENLKIWQMRTNKNPLMLFLAEII